MDIARYALKNRMQENRNTGPTAWKDVLKPKSAHIPCLRRFRRGTSQSDMVNLLKAHHKMLPIRSATADREAGSGWLRRMHRPDHFDCRARITNQTFRAMNS